MFTLEDQQVYTDNMSMTRPHKEELLKLVNRSLKRKEVSDMQKVFTRQMKDISSSENLLNEVNEGSSIKINVYMYMHYLKQLKK